jgi:hypothetical protein
MSGEIDHPVNLPAAVDTSEAGAAVRIVFVYDSDHREGVSVTRSTGDHPRPSAASGASL